MSSSATMAFADDADPQIESWSPANARTGPLT
jgi:hypothetical protein